VRHAEDGLSRPLNLARRPFRNERLPTLLLAVGSLVLGGLTVRHAIVARNLLPGRALAVEREAVALDREVASLRAEADKLGGEREPTPAVREWAAVKELVDRRAFSWTALFADLEKALPPGVRLVAVAPQVEKGRLVLSLSAMGREVDDALALYDALQRHPRFRGAQLVSYSEAPDGIDITCRVAYAPPGASDPEPASKKAAAAVGGAARAGTAATGGAP
jgi:Tfp pilus assembly protein PilN